MRAGEIWTASAGDRGYAGKPRPVVIVQENLIDEFDSVVLCLLTSSDEKTNTVFLLTRVLLTAWRFQAGL